MDVTDFLESLKKDPEYAGQIVHVRNEPARTPAWASFPKRLHPGVRQFLDRLGVSRLYTHQAEAIEAALAGEDVLITTGPASGKSVCYQAPILQRVIEDPAGTALLVFPSKALARDQMASWNSGIRELHDHLDPTEAAAAPFDADAGASDRRKARETGRLLVTNPEMVHMAMLPGHGRWQRFLSGLSFVVLDEVHTYTGFFGANMANVMRRLDRVCEHYGARPQFICSSATVGNPVEMAERVTGRRLRHVGHDASAAGTRTHIFWNPPKIKRRKWRGRRSANVEAHELMVKLIRRHISTICFSKARNTAEMIYRYVRETLQKEAPTLADRVIPYRGGYSPVERREMERRLREGEILGVSATRALELGIDVGSLDACIVVGYPGLLSAFFQQTGRAGRSGRDSLCILVGTGTLINQYVMGHPEFVFDRPVERAIVDEENPFVVVGHVRCATAELPVTEPEMARFGYATRMSLEVLEEEKKIRRIEDAWYHASSEQPAHEVRLRGYGDESTVVMDADTERVIDRLDKFRALRIFYPGAIYFHRGDTYAMVEHDFERNVVRVRRTDVPYYTDPVTGTAVNHVDVVLDERPLGTGRACLGEVFAVLSTPLYEKVRFYTLDRISQHELDVPSIAYEAMSFWLIPPDTLAAELVRLGLSPESGLKGILYCVSRILPLFLTSDANDFDWTLGCRNSTPYTMFWFEFYRHGIGHAEQAYERLEDILGLTLEHLLTCDCEDGCPNCTSRLITPYHVRNIELGEGTVHSRRAAAAALNSLLTGEPADESLALLDSRRGRRGQEFLPTVKAEHTERQPHRIPLDERTRRLMLRKIERAREPRQPVDHPIDPVPQTGIPVPERDDTVGVADSEKRSGRRGGRRVGDDLSRRLRRRIEGKVGQGPVPEQRSAGPSVREEQGRVQPADRGNVIKAGDDVARRAVKLRRKKRRG